MENFTFWSPTKFVFGRNAEEQSGALARQFGATKALIVSGGGSAVRSGLLGRVERSIREAGIEVMHLAGIAPNPTDDRVYEGIDMVRSSGIDFIVAVGGGSVIDTAKAIACGALYDGDFWDFYCGRATVEKAIPVGVVLTIPAAGSEGSGNSVITKRDGLVKMSLRTEHWLRPKWSVLNPVLTFTLPPYQTACGIVDMMAHIMERYFSNTPGGTVTDHLAEALLKAIIETAPKVFANPDDYDARANIMWAGTLAHNGLCGSGRVEDWASHFIEHELSAVYNVAHGAGLAVTIPAWMTYVSATNPGKLAQMAVNVFGIPAAGKTQAELAAGAIEAMRSFFKSIGMPLTMMELGIENPDIERLTSALHLHKGDTVGNYVPIHPADTRKIYELMC